MPPFKNVVIFRVKWFCWRKMLSTKISIKFVFTILFESCCVDVLLYTEANQWDKWKYQECAAIDAMRHTLPAMKWYTYLCMCDWVLLQLTVAPLQLVIDLSTEKDYYVLLWNVAARHRRHTLCTLLHHDHPSTVTVMTWDTRCACTPIQRNF